MQSVLVGVDESDGGRAASLMGAWLSERLGLELVLAHVCGEPPPSPGDDAAQRTRVQHASSRRAMALLEGIEPAAARRTIGSGKAAPVLAELAREEDAALIVVASRGRGARWSAFSRSVSRALTIEAEQPVVVVPPPAFARVLRLELGDADVSIVCGLDESDDAARAATAAVELSERMGSRLSFVHAVDRRSQVMDEEQLVPVAARAIRLDGHGPDSAADAPARVIAGEAAEALERVAREEQAALIVVGARGRGRFARALFGSVSAALTARAPCPVMVVPPGAELHLAVAGAADSRHRG